MFIGKLQGAGEQGAVKQLQDINKYGEYSVETSEASQKVLVTLEIVSDDEQISKKKWSLSELHELESKLVLITRRTATWVDDKRLFQEVCYYSGILILL